MTSKGKNVCLKVFSHKQEIMKLFLTLFDQSIKFVPVDVQCSYNDHYIFFVTMSIKCLRKKKK